MWSVIGGSLAAVALIVILMIVLIPGKKKTAFPNSSYKGQKDKLTKALDSVPTEKLSASQKNDKGEIPTSMILLYGDMTPSRGLYFAELKGLKAKWEAEKKTDDASAKKKKDA